MNKTMDVNKYFLQCKVMRGKSIRFEDPVRLARCTVNCNLSVGAYTYIRGGRIVALRSIGRFCSVAPGLTVGDGDHPMSYLSTHPFQYKGTDFTFNSEWVDFRTSTTTMKQNLPSSIGSDVWIGANVTIMRGVKVGHGSVLGAGAIVTRDVLPYEIVLGVPAKHHRFRFEPKIIERLLKLEWWNYTLKSLEGVPFDKVEEALDVLERRSAAGLLEKRPAALFQFQDNVISAVV
ncbi:MAG: CatB-related O-acetyltransferase [Syntrophobacteraceae bacterium]